MSMLMYHFLCLNQGLVHRMDLVIYLPERKTLLEKIVFQLNLPSRPENSKEEIEAVEFSMRSLLASASMSETLRRHLPNSKELIEWILASRVFFDLMCNKSWCILSFDSYVTDALH